MSRVRMSCSRWFRTVAVVSIIWLVAAEIVMAQAAIRSAPGPRLSKAQWIWDRAHTGNSGKFSCFFRKSFELEGRPSAGIALVTADNNFEFYVNGTLVGSDANPAGTGWNVVEWYEIGHLLQAGKNVLAVKGVNWGQWGGLTVAVRVRHDGAGGDLELWSDETWRMATESGFTKGRIICCTGCRFARGRVMFLAALLRAHHGDNTGLFRGLDHGAAFDHGVGKRLFHEDVLPGLAGVDERQPVPMLGCGDHHRVDVLAIENLSIVPLPIGLASEKLISFVQALAVDVADHRDLYVAKPAEDRHELAPAPTTADDPQPYPFISCLRSGLRRRVRLPPN